MKNIKKRIDTYIIGKPNNIPAGEVEVDIDDIIKEINQLSIQSIDAQGVDDAGNKSSSAKVLRKLSTKNGDLDSLVVEMSDDIIKKLNQRHKNTIIIEKDDPIFPIDANEKIDAPVTSMDNVILSSDADKLIINIIVKDSEDKAVKNARVTLTGSLWSDEGFTDKNGKITLTLIDETIASISLIEVKPAHTYWSIRISQPAMIDTEENVIILNKIDEAFSEKNSNQYVGWGQNEMNLNLTSNKNKETQKKIKVVVIDSGISESHSDLSPQNGYDFGETKQPKKDWKKDTSGHGTHVSGICAAVNNESGILGFASDAQLSVLRIFPNASNSKLISALDWCIDQKVDVINMSLGGKKASQLVQQRLQACRESGILPIAAAGNNGGDVLYPAAFKEVLSVAAIGRFGSFPDDSLHNKHIGDKPIKSGEYFSPKFTSRGPEVDVCAPGVAIISTVPGNGYAAWDGTSMACPHVTGFAARLLDNSPSILNLPRSDDRSQRLFDAILDSCKFIEGIPENFQGRGLPRFKIQDDKDVLPDKDKSDTSKEGDNDLSEIADLIKKAIAIIESNDL